MRKKSHISLAKYIVDAMDAKELCKHKKAFYLGSILPDCKPSFLTTKHEFNGTFEKVQESIEGLTINCDIMSRNARVYWRQLGEVIHYMADYFTFPHNHTYDGTLKEHCIYEKHLKHGLKEYIRSGEAARNAGKMQKFETPEALCKFIRTAHEEYLQFKRTVEEDCRYIVALCHQVVEAVVYLLNRQMERFLAGFVAAEGCAA